MTIPGKPHSLNWNNSQKLQPIQPFGAVSDSIYVSGNTNFECQAGGKRAGKHDPGPRLRDYLFIALLRLKPRKNLQAKYVVRFFREESADVEKNIPLAW